VERIRDAVAGWEIKPIHAGLFGSFARGVADAESDIDVLVVRPESLFDEGTWLVQIDSLNAHPCLDRQRRPDH
jgi:predicted nucleotidyltransferase